MRGRPPTRKTGAYTAAERMRRCRRRLKRPQPSAKTVVKQQRRAEREAELAATVKASQTLGAKLYGVLYADPPGVRRSIRVKPVSIVPIITTRH